jgi:HTH-type transcriptional regulator, global nitrogen regulator NrpRI
MKSQSVRDPEHKLINILKTLNRSAVPLGSFKIADSLKNDGINLDDRTIRYHLKLADERGFTRSLGRSGRMITEAGRQEIKQALAVQHLGNVVDKLKMLAFQTTFDPQTFTGQLPVNVSFIESNDFPKALSVMKSVFNVGYSVSDMVAIASEGETLGSVTIPTGKIGVATVCSVAVYGVLLKAGIPTEYRFSGMLEVKNNVPKRFIAAIDYSGTSLDPSEEFILSRMTSVNSAVKNGNGQILGAFRTIPLPAKTATKEKIAELKKAGIGGVYAFVDNYERLFQVSVDPDRVGLVQFNGLNPIAAVVESGIAVESNVGVGLIDYQQLKPVGKLQTTKSNQKYSLIWD